MKWSKVFLEGKGGGTVQPSVAKTKTEMDGCAAG